MKHFQLILLLAALPLLSTAQVKLEPNGKVIMGEKNAQWNSDAAATVSVYGTGTGTYPKVSFGQLTKNSSGNYTGAFVGEWMSSPYGGGRLWLNYGKGLYITGNGVPDNGSTSSSGLLLYYDVNVPTGMIHIFKDISSEGRIYSRGILLTSDARLKTDVKGIENPLIRLQQLQGVNYRLLEKPGETQPADVESKIQPASGEQSGFLAQELEKVFPNLVETDTEGYKSIDYIGLIPVIVEALKEQNTIMAAQSEKIKELESKLAGATGENPIVKTYTSNAATQNNAKMAIEATVIANAFLYQNAPNPFNTATTIRYFLSSEAGNASLYIFDMQGKLVESYPISQVGEGSVEISAPGLQPGMYLYSLLINGQEVDTKRMVITE